MIKALFLSPGGFHAFNTIDSAEYDPYTLRSSDLADPPDRAFVDKVLAILPTNRPMHSLIDYYPE